MKKSFIQRISLIFSDGISLGVSLILAVYILNILRPGSQEYIDLNKLGLAKIFGFFILAVFWQQEHYTKRRPTWEEIKLLFETIFIFAILHFMITYLLAHHIVKLVNIVFWFLLLFVLPFCRYLTRKLLLFIKQWQRDVYIVGYGKNAIATYQLLQQNYLLGYTVIGFVDIDNTEDSHSRQLIDSIPLFGYNHLLYGCSNNDVEIIFALEPNQLIQHTKNVDILQTKFTFVSVVPDVIGLPLYGVSVDHFFGSDHVFLRLKNNLSRRINRFIKRISDMVLASLGLLLLSPVFIIFAVLIKSSGDKVFFKHKRLGRGGEHFYCIKFQTMHRNSQKILDKLLEDDEEIRKEWQIDFKLKNDPRVTKLGKFLRSSSLDEIPQLFNVLIGDMSLVGPRPVVDGEINKYGDDFYYYKLVRPGITGLWQISGRNDIDYTKRVRLDIWYVKNWSLWYDFVIIFRTIIVVLGRKGAY